jgi:hypothetical protein
MVSAKDNYPHVLDNVFILFVEINDEPGSSSKSISLSFSLEPYIFFQILIGLFARFPF